VIFLADFNNCDQIFRQLAAIYSFPSHGINSIKIFLPYFSTGTMDRISEPGEVVTSKTLARMLSVIPPAACPPQIFIFDIHALQELHYFSDKVRVHGLTGIHLFKEHLNELFLRDTLSLPISIAFPDEGAHKRFKPYFENYDLIICEKRRVGKKRIITIKEGDPKGKRVYIVDDLILSGATMLGCAEVLKGEGAVSVGAYATHAVFPLKNWHEFRESGVNLYLSNSCPVTINEIKNDSAMRPENMEVISLTPVISQEIFRSSN